MKESIDIAGIWLQRIGNKLRVIVEREGMLYLAIEEHVDGPTSHYVHPTGIRNAPLCDTSGDTTTKLTESERSQ